MKIDLALLAGELIAETLKIKEDYTYMCEKAVSLGETLRDLADILASNPGQLFFEGQAYNPSIKPRFFADSDIPEAQAIRELVEKIRKTKMLLDRKVERLEKLGIGLCS